MSAHTKKTETPLPSLIIADDEWARHMERPGLRVIDVFAKWAGPCDAMQGIFKRLKTEHGEAVTFVQAQTDFIEALKNFRDKSRPTFLLFFSGVLVKIITGANGPAIEKSIKEQIDLEKSGGVHKPILLESGSEILEPSPERASVAENIHAEIKKEEQEIKAASREILADSPAKVDDTPTSPVKNSSRAFALIKPDGMIPSVIEVVMEQIRSNRFLVDQTKKVWLTPDSCNELFKEHVEKPFFQSLVTYMTSGPCLAIILSKENAAQEWKDLIGPANPSTSKDSDPKSLREFFGSENRINAVYASENQELATRDIEIVFGETTKLLEMPISEDEMSIKTSAGTQKTLCIIKSEDSVVRNAIIERILFKGIEIHKRDEVKFEPNQVEEMFPGLPAEAAQFLSKSSHLALVLMGENVINSWKEMAGPEDPEVAKNVAPQSIRALFGRDIVQNAVHASVSVEKALTEVMQVFPMILERHGSVALRDSRVGTAANPYPVEHKMSKQELHEVLERTFAIIKPDAYGTGKKDLIIDKIVSEGFKIVKEAEVTLSLNQAQEFYKEHHSKPFYDELIGWMSGNAVYALVLEKQGAVNAWRELIGPNNSVKAREIAPNSIRALYGTDGSHNAVHGSDAPISAEREIKIVFGDLVSSSPDPLPLSPVEAEAGKGMGGGSKMGSQRWDPLQKKAETKSTENVLNLILGKAPDPVSQPNPDAALELTPTPPPGASKSRPSSQRNSLSNLNKSIPKLTGSSSKLSGSKGNLMGSLSKLTGSKSKLNS